jgi:hypothetical protein
MANAFKRKLQRAVGTSATSVGSYTVGAGIQATLIGLTVSNILSTNIVVDVMLNDGTNDTYIVKGATILPGGALVAVGGDQKIVLEPNDSIKVQSDTASSCDVVMSLLEIS